MSTTTANLPAPSSRLIVSLAFIAWFLLLAASCIYWMARPEEETFLDRRWHKTVRAAWDSELVTLGL
ncbi:MAG: hypothetical protein ABIF77_20415, partial [bacterium]